MTDSQFVNPNNTQARDDNSYKEVIEKIQKDKVCPFCPENLSSYHKNPILKENTHWLVTKNMYPYKGAAHHFLLLHKIHITKPKEMTQEDRLDFFEIVEWTIEEFKIPGGTFFMRFGDTHYTGASVAHLHAQLVSSNPDKENYEPILTRIG